MNQKLYFINDYKSYPVAHLGNEEIEIHFLHYKTDAEAKEKWERRTERLFNVMDNKSDLFVKFCDIYEDKKEDLDKFHLLPFNNKISFTVEEYLNQQNIYVPYLKSRNVESIVNGLQLFKQRYRCFDFVKWIQTGKISKRIIMK